MTIDNKKILTPAKRPATLDLSIICLAGFILSLVINYPGFMSFDSVQQLLEARSGVYSDLHPPFLAFLWHLTDRIVPGPFGILIVGTALVWCGTYLISLFWFSDAHPILRLAPCLLILYPPIFGISGVIWADNIMWAFLTLAIGLAGAIKPVSAVTGYRCIAKFALASTFLFAAILCRHNAFIAVMPLVALGVVRGLGADRSPRRLVAGSVIGGLVFAAMLFGATLLNNALTSYSMLPWHGLALFDIAGVIHQLPDADEQKAIYARLPAQVRGSGSLENLLHTYSPDNWETLVQPVHPAFRPEPFTQNKIVVEESDLSPQDRRALMDLWLETDFHHPLAWLRHRISAFKAVTGFGYEVAGLVFMKPNGFPDWVAAIYGHQSPELNHLQKGVNWVLSHLSEQTFFWRPWCYLVLTVLLIGACLAFRALERIEISLIAASGLAHEAGFFLLASSAEFRYSHYMIYTSGLALLLFLKTLRNKREATLKSIASAH
jgi:hypothetical protein